MFSSNQTEKPFEVISAPFSGDLQLLDKKSLYIAIFPGCELTFLKHVNFGESSSSSFASINFPEKNYKFRFFHSVTLEKNSKIKIKDFNVDESVEILPNKNLIMKEGAKIKISTFKPALFNTLKKLSDANPAIEITLKYRPN